MSSHRLSILRRGAGALLGSILLLATSSSALAGIANRGIAGASARDPLAGLQWGNYSGSLDEVFPAYNQAQGTDKQLLGLIALRPRMRWFGSWYRDGQAKSVAREYLANVTGGRSDVLAQMAVFRLAPWEGAACRSLPSAAQQRSYKRWINGFATGIGSARVALVLQPDLPFAACVPHHSSLPLRLVAYAARRFSSLPHTSVYIDAGASDWAGAGRAAAMLRAAGVRYTRGFALGATHYDSTQREIAYGQQIVRWLTAHRIRNRHFVINTAQNGRPFTYQQYHRPNFDNARACASASDRRCVTLGIPPTWHVADPRWGLSPRARSVASRLVDAYLWIGRPWLDNQSDPFDGQRSLLLAASTPF